MKQVYVQITFILALFFNYKSVRAEQLITLFLKPYPVVSVEAASNKLAKKLHKPGKIARTRLKHSLLTPISGLFATYGGYLTISDLNGEISFPRKHSAKHIYLVISAQLTPIIMSGNTIAHWELEEGNPAVMYQIEQVWDPDLKLYYWNVTQELLPQDLHVPLESIALFADPKYIYVPLGISIIKESPHLILPDIYVKKGINLIEDALYILNLTHYFGTILPIYKKEKVRYSKHLTY